MAKMADALREKARQEQQAYQDRRNQATEWGPMPEGTEADRPIPIAPVAHVAGDETSRYLEWAKDRSAWEMPVGTPVYYDALASAPVADMGNPMSPAPVDTSSGHSAPVAGEAMADLIEELSDLASDMAYEANQEMDQEKATRAAIIERGERALRRFAYAAPQASEAAHKEAAAMARSFGAPDMADALDPAKGPIQASEAVRDAGIAASEDVAEMMREVLQWIVDDAASGGVAKLRPQQAKRARAALSAQPGAQKGGGDAN